MSDILVLTDTIEESERPYTRKENVKYALVVLATVSFGTMTLGWVALAG